MNVILKSGLIRILEDSVIGCSGSYSCGWINTDDLRKIADMIDNGEYDKFGNKAYSRRDLLLRGNVKDI